MSAPASGFSAPRSPKAPVDWAPWMVLISTIALSFKGISAKYAYDAGMGVGMVLILRFVLAAPFFWVGERLLGAGRPRLPLGWAEIRPCILAGVLFSVATYSDFSSVQLIGAGLSRVILFTYPAVILIIGAFSRRTWPARRQMLAFAITYLGLLIIIVPSVGLVAVDVMLEGVAMSLLSSVTYGSFLVYSQSLTGRLGSARFTAISNTVTMLMIVPFALAMGGDLTIPNTTALIWAVVIATVCTVLPFFLLFEGIRRWGAEKTGLMTLSGPALTIAMAWVLLDETLTPLQLIGFAVVMAGVGALQGVDRPLLRLLRRGRRAEA
ncbi:DMT family transporter [Rhodospirillum rubrum]|uniref:EamA domain-containing protein n=2 Tax=Rhodospirillum rubrum TaxID=1085 RepID=Q2RXK9_RHORT|nr:DMT family transporter [Rhodospirillum rubrum]ABC21136.1 Protein of unknown function DUF6, transmembrane [Rhodospirillum rubrum ATCC 11170]AEO46804.1 hypothetical protein F11_01670 [Rhodospirillum rubrum F11]MBK5952683.1 EamA family transporter [Rhodospirillum rubrum]QXG80827.1 DMT family transporter [Rhodospirillum rubrum]HAQ01123.1 EamA/RhaT family transporter [Rhodospirillum rubrum]